MKQLPKIAEVFDPNRTTAHNVLKRCLRTGEIENKPRVTRTQKKLTAAQEIKTKSWVDENCTISLKTISKKCMHEFSVKICKSTASNSLTGFNIS
ncbi:hypothetical protein HZS_1818 [Henneguya salminicola]|nr:hypothetical protein HZS_1818 [Henneguya salminicola]